MSVPDPKGGLNDGLGTGERTKRSEPVVPPAGAAPAPGSEAALTHRLRPPAPPRSPWQLVYGAAHRARRAWYRERAGQLPRPVVSVGNLHWGGTGKTPLTAAVAAHLRDRGLGVCILSRGYGGGGRGVRVVSDGGGPLLGPEDAGDEPVLLASELPGVAVVVGARREAAGRHALAHLAPPPDLFLLDDGFSHLALHRDLDLLAFPAADPFAGGRLPPGGRLREPLAAARRADAALLTGLPAKPGEGDPGDRDAAENDPGEGAPGQGDPRDGGPRKCDHPPWGARLAAALRPHGFAGPGFACSLAAEPPRRLDGEPLPAGTRVLLVCAIARPGRFEAAARRACAEAGLVIAGSLGFRDHHSYPQDDLERIRHSAAENAAAVVLTTSKDRVKLAGRLALPLAELPVRAMPEAAFWSWLDDRLAPLLEASATRAHPAGAHPADSHRTGEDR